jgi:hypothetical protein
MIWFVLRAAAALSVLQQVNAIVQLELHPVQYGRLEEKFGSLQSRKIDHGVRDEQQQPLGQVHPKPFGVARDSGNIFHAGAYMFGFNITLGTPAQEVPIVLCIDCDTLLIQSSACSSDICHDYEHHGFNASLSTSFHRNDSHHFYAGFAGASWRGNYAKEVIGMAGASFADVDLQFADEVNASWPNFYAFFDGVVGLSPKSIVWKSIVSSPAVEKPIVGLRFPKFYPEPTRDDVFRPDPRDNGTLTLGGIEAAYENKSFWNVPLANDGSAWAAHLDSIWMCNDINQCKIFVFPRHAVLSIDTTNPLIILPTYIANHITSIAERYATDHFLGDSLPVFPCNVREELPSLEFDVGDADSGSLSYPVFTAYDYVVDLPEWLGYGSDMCVLGIVGWGKGHEKDNDVQLGWVGLRHWYTVLDGEYEGGRIRCKSSLCPLDTRKRLTDQGHA